MTREPRAYIACLYCRQRKSKCIIDESNPGQQRQCRRCKRENRHCVITNTRRANRQSDAGTRTPAQHDQHNADAAQAMSVDWQAADTTPHRRTTFEIDTSSRNMPHASMIDRRDAPYTHDQGNIDQQLNTPEWQTDRASAYNRRSSSPEEAVAGGQLQNPRDALELLARVARRSPTSPSSQVSNEPEDVSRHEPSMLDTTISLFQNIRIPIHSAQSLILQYKEKCHPFFPIANERVLDPNCLEVSAREEPHLLLVILTIASKQDLAHAETYNTCLQELKHRLAQIVCLPPPKIEAVEALLLLSEWTPQKFETHGNIGSGEEDRAAWMQVGLAVRLGYLQGLETTSFHTRTETESQSKIRRRVAWAACFMSDRLISVRVGKAFWSRGPGPSSVRAFDDYLPFKSKPPLDDDYSSVFQAHMELTKLLSNAHDVLYASVPHRDRLFKSGEYAKYIDDFRTAINEWNAEWGSITCSPGIKSSLILSCEYLRLYVSAFAYQATLSRLEAEAKAQSGPTSISVKQYFTQQLAGTPDARFIYESISAAKSLLSTFNCFVDPVSCLRYMPIKYYLYVIYAAVYLYKARATGALDESNTKQLNQIIWRTIVRLQQSSSSFDDIGCRYSRLLAMLWKKPLRLDTRAQDAPNANSSARTPDTMPRNRQESSSRRSGQNARGEPLEVRPTSLLDSETSMQQTPQFFDTFPCDIEGINLGAFDWNDLGAVGQFATANNSVYGDDLAPVFEDFQDATMFNGFLGSAFPQFNP